MKTPRLTVNVNVTVNFDAAQGLKWTYRFILALIAMCLFH